MFVPHIHLLRDRVMEKKFCIICFENNEIKKRFNDDCLWILGSFFVTEVGCYWTAFENFIYDDATDEAEGNIIGLRKDGDDILLNFIYSDEQDKGPFLRLHTYELIYLLGQWKEFCKSKPKEILITYDDEEKIVMKPLFKEAGEIDLQQCCE